MSMMIQIEIEETKLTVLGEFEKGQSGDDMEPIDDDFNAELILAGDVNIEPLLSASMVRDIEKECLKHI